MADAALAPESPHLGPPADLATAQACSQRADLGDLLDAIAGAIHTIETATTGVTATTKLVQSALALVAQADAADILAAADDLSAALIRLRSQAQALGSNLSSVQVRQDFAIAMINTLPPQADGLAAVARDQEGANLLALQTRQQQSAATLLLAAQASQAVMRSFE